MATDINTLLQKVSNNERASGLMTVFQALPREEQVALLEWARTICIKLSSVMEKQSLDTARPESVDLPAPKPFIELALKVGAIRALTTDNKDLLDGCQKAYKHVLGDAKYKVFEDFEETVLLTLHLSKW